MDSVTKYLNAGALEPSGFCCCFVGGFVCFGSGNLGFLNIVLELAEFTGSYENIDSLLLLSPNFVPGTPHRGDGVGGKLAYHTSTLPFNVLLFLASPPPKWNKVLYLYLGVKSHSADRWDRWDRWGSACWDQGENPVLHLIRGCISVRSSLSGRQVLVGQLFCLHMK